MKLKRKREAKRRITKTKKKYHHKSCKANRDEEQGTTEVRCLSNRKQLKSMNELNVWRRLIVGRVKVESSVEEVVSWMTRRCWSTWFNCSFRSWRMFSCSINLYLIIDVRCWKKFVSPVDDSFDGVNVCGPMDFLDFFRRMFVRVFDLDFIDVWVDDKVKYWNRCDMSFNDCDGLVKDAVFDELCSEIEKTAESVDEDTIVAVDFDWTEESTERERDAFAWRFSSRPFLLIEMLIGFETCCSVFVLIDEIESRSNGDDQRRLAARIICSMISDGFGSLASVEISFSVVMELVTGVNLGIWGFISTGIFSKAVWSKNHS